MTTSRVYVADLDALICAELTFVSPCAHSWRVELILPSIPAPRISHWLVHISEKSGGAVGSASEKIATLVRIRGVKEPGRPVAAGHEKVSSSSAGLPRLRQERAGGRDVMLESVGMSSLEGEGVMSSFGV
jgi:hypothetical protein